MQKQAVFTMKLEPELRDEFMTEAKADDRPASQVVRELMRDYIKHRKEARAYDEFLRQKVEAGRAAMFADNGLSNEAVEAEFAARRAKAANQE